LNIDHILFNCFFDIDVIFTLSNIAFNASRRCRSWRPSKKAEVTEFICSRSLILDVMDFRAEEVFSDCGFYLVHRLVLNF
jgi:hypothetical protein